MILSKQGISIDLPPGWEGRAFVPDDPPPARNYPVVHATSFPMAADDSSYGGRLAASIGAAGTLLSLVEFDPGLAGDALFRQGRLPVSVRLEDLNPSALQVRRAGHAGAQRFFAAAGRAFCLYVVVGTGTDAAGSVRALNAVLATLRITPERTG